MELPLCLQVTWISFLLAMTPTTLQSLTFWTDQFTHGRPKTLTDSPGTSWIATISLQVPSNLASRNFCCTRATLSARLTSALKCLSRSSLCKTTQRDRLKESNFKPTRGLTTSKWARPSTLRTTSRNQMDSWHQVETQPPRTISQSTTCSRESFWSTHVRLESRNSTRHCASLSTRGSKLSKTFNQEPLFTRSLHSDLQQNKTTAIPDFN